MTNVHATLQSLLENTSALVTALMANRGSRVSDTAKLHVAGELEQIKNDLVAIGNADPAIATTATDSGPLAVVIAAASAASNKRTIDDRDDRESARAADTTPCTADSVPAPIVVTGAKPVAIRVRRGLALAASARPSAPTTVVAAVVDDAESDSTSTAAAAAAAAAATTQPPRKRRASSTSAEQPATTTTDTAAVPAAPKRKPRVTVAPIADDDPADVCALERLAITCRASRVFNTRWNSQVAEHNPSLGMCYVRTLLEGTGYRLSLDNRGSKSPERVLNSIADTERVYTCALCYVRLGDTAYAEALATRGGQPVPIQNVLGVSMPVCDSCFILVSKCAIAPGADTEPHLCRSCLIDNAETPVHVVRRSASECAPLCSSCLQTPLLVEALCYLRRHGMLVEQSAEVEAAMARRAQWATSAAPPAESPARAARTVVVVAASPQTPARQRSERAAKSSALSALAATPAADTAMPDASSSSSDSDSDSDDVPLVPATATSTSAAAPPVVVDVGAEPVAPPAAESAPAATARVAHQHDTACCACKRDVGGAEEFVRCSFEGDGHWCPVVKCHRCIRAKMANDQLFRQCVAYWMCAEHRD
jgi:hypothetical protein